MNSTAVQGITLQRTASWLFLLLWVVVSALGFLFIGVMFHYPGDIPRGDFVVFDLPIALLELFAVIFNPGAALFGFLLATLTGLLVGWLQWLVLRRYLAGAAWWIAAVALGIGVNHAFFDGAPLADFAPLFVVISGLVLGLVQWLVLRNRVSQAAWWIPVSLVGWYLAWLLGTLALNTTGPLYLAWIPVIGDDPHAVFSLPFGVVYSALTGVFWLWLLREQKASAVSRF